jgi:heme oxygenase
VAGNGVVVTRQLSFSAELRSLTRNDHEGVEKVLDLPWRLQDRSDLAAVLEAWSALWSDVRSGCGHVGRDESARLLVASVRAVRQIAGDLDDLAVAGASAPAGSLRTGEPVLAPLLATPAGVWAVSYVLRGSRVGGTVLAPSIAERLRLPEGMAAAYYADADAGRAWVTFRRRIDSWGRVAGTSAREQTLQLAHEVFNRVGERLAAVLPPPPPDDDHGPEMAGNGQGGPR